MPPGVPGSISVSLSVEGSLAEALKGYPVKCFSGFPSSLKRHKTQKTASEELIMFIVQYVILFEDSK